MNTKKTKARFSRLLHLAWKRRGPILVSVLRNVTYLLRHLPTYLQPWTHPEQLQWNSYSRWPESITDSWWKWLLTLWCRIELEFGVAEENRHGTRLVRGTVWGLIKYSISATHTAAIVHISFTTHMHTTWLLKSTSNQDSHTTSAKPQGLSAEAWLCHSQAGQWQIKTKG